MSLFMSKAIERFLTIVIVLSGIGAVTSIGIGLWLATAGIVHAGERSDYINSLEPSEYCEVIAEQFYAGILGKLYGSAREFKGSTPLIIESLEHGIPLPKDALYVFEWDKLDDAEKAFVRKHVLAGYDKATSDLTDQAAMSMGQAYFDACMEARKSLKRTGFIRVEALENVAPAKRLSQCTEWLTDYKVIGLAVKHGRDCDQMKQWTKDTEGVLDDRRAKIARIVDEACAAGRDGVDAWFEAYSKKCMAK